MRHLKECHGARSGQGTRASARRKRFHPLTAPARHDRGMLVGTKGVPTVSNTPPAGPEQRAAEKRLNDPRLANGETNARAEQETSPWSHEVLARCEYWHPSCGRSAKIRIKQRLSL